MKRPRPIKAARRYCCGCFVWSIAVVALGAWWAGRQLGPVSSRPTVVRVRIPAGSSSSRVAAILEERGVIRDARLFLLYARLRGGADKLKAGNYRFSQNMSAAEVLTRLGQGQALREDIAVTIPEGYTIRQIGTRMQAKGIIASADSFIRLANGPTDTFNAAFPLPRKRLEGYLFPETYRFLPKCAPEKVIQQMLDTLDSQFYSRHKDEIRKSGHTLHELLTIASLIEREAEVEADRAMIAGVIENRLKKKMRLEIDATVIYAKGRHVARVLYKDLQIESPYNTYRHSGLPPGPIASPGLASLEAALHPAKHDYLYYVTIEGGAHTFARTEAEHNRNVAKMRAHRELQTQ